MLERVKKIQRVQKIKTHFQEHKTVYVTGASFLVVGLVGGALASNSNKVSAGHTADAWKLLHLQYKSPNVVEQSTVVQMPAKGHRGNVVVCNETGAPYPSQNAAAKELGLNPGLLSGHLQGKFKSVNGYTFTNLGENLEGEVRVSK